MRLSFRISTSRPALAGVILLAAACSDGGSSAPTAPVAAAASCAAQASVDLQPGQTTTLTAAQAECFSLAAHASARYVLAGFDARSIDAAAGGGPEQAAAGDPTYVLGDGSGASPTIIASPQRAPDAAAGAGDVVPRRDAASSPDAADPFLRAAPWTDGERFTVRRVDNGQPATARVVRIYNGRYVFAVLDDDRTSHTDHFVSDTQDGMEFMLRQGVPLLDRVFGERRPSTSAGSGQLLILYGAWNPDQGLGSAVTDAARDGSGVSTYLWLNLNARPGVRDAFNMFDVPSMRLKVLAHEMTHAWQMRYAYETQPAGPRTVAFGPAWAIEGTADLLAMDVVRRSLGISLTGNWDWQAHLKSANTAITYALEPADTRGRLAQGYFDAASFLRDVQVRLARAGSAEDDALATVARGALEGWFGMDAAGVRRQGLAARVRAVLGAQWDPSSAVLLWTATQAADDQAQSPELNNPVYARAADPDGDYAWKPAVADVQAGRAFAYQLTGAPGSSFFVRLKDDGRGGTISARSSTAATRWMVARTK